MNVVTRWTKWTISTSLGGAYGSGGKQCLINQSQRDKYDKEMHKQRFRSYHNDDEWMGASYDGRNTFIFVMHLHTESSGANLSWLLSSVTSESSFCCTSRGLVARCLRAKWEGKKWNEKTNDVSEGKGGNTKRYITFCITFCITFYISSLKKILI